LRALLVKENGDLKSPILFYNETAAVAAPRPRDAGV
jgi:hypothetical protein